MRKERTKALVDRLVVGGQCQKEAVEELMQRRNAVDALCQHGLVHPDEQTRHLAAELLRDAESTKAVPALIKALRDESPHVRFDALSALCKTLKTDIGWWLDIEAYHNTPADMHTRVSEWWRRNRHYVWW